jgi:hypothetical protein
MDLSADNAHNPGLAVRVLERLGVGICQRAIVSAIGACDAFHVNEGDLMAVWEPSNQISRAGAGNVLENADALAHQVCSDQKLSGFAKHCQIWGRNTDQTVGAVSNASALIRAKDMFFCTGAKAAPAFGALTQSEGGFHECFVGSRS